MARVDNNIMTRFSSGAIGKQLVLRNRGNDSFLSNRPKRKKRRKKTPKQIEVRLKFREAAKYATGVSNDPLLRLDYEAKVLPGQTAYNVAFADAFMPPELSALKTSGYKGMPGNILTVRALDNFKVESVSFEIIGADDTEIETGLATPDENSLDWNYTVKTQNDSLPGTLIRVTATDRPKNQTILEQTL